MIRNIRDTKFRGRRKDNGEWIYGSLIKDVFCSPDENLVYILDVTQIDNYDCWMDIAEWMDELEVINSTVGEYTEQNDIDGNEIYEGMTVHQISILVGSPDIDFIGEVKFYDGSWFIDNGESAVFLFNETCENKIIKEY